MGCLTAVISPSFLYDIHSSVENQNTGLDSVIENLNSQLVTETENINDLEVSVQSYSPTLIAGVTFIPQTITAQLSLVCQISPGVWENLQVLEGSIITIDGQYIKVHKRWHIN